MEWYKYVSIVAGVLTLLIAIGGAWAIVVGSFNKARVATLREDVGDLEKRVESRDAEIAAMKIKETSLENTVAQQQTEIEMLTSMLTQRAEVGEVLKELKEHHNEARQFWSSQTMAMTALLDRLEQKDA